MYRIAICDGDKLTSGNIERIIMEYAQCIPLRITIDVFGNAEELHGSLMKGVYYDTIFLEIYLNKSSGIELGVQIRRELGNSMVNIIFITSLPEKILEIFAAEPQGVVIKPVVPERVIGIFRQMLARYDRFSEGIFTYSVVGTTYRIPLADIIYFRVTERTIYIKTVNKEDWFYGSLKSVRQRLTCEDFFMANRNHFVNINHISSYNNREIYMSCNEKIILGNKNSKTFMEIQKLYV